jgi:hypothetical protein
MFPQEHMPSLGYDHIPACAMHFIAANMHWHLARFLWIEAMSVNQIVESDLVDPHCSIVSSLPALHARPQSAVSRLLSSVLQSLKLAELVQF